MKISHLFLRIAALGAACALILTVLATFPPVQAAFAEPATNTRPARPTSVLLKKRSVVHGAVTALCTLTAGTSAKSRECVITNRSDQLLCVKYTATDTACSATTIAGGCTGETDIAVVGIGATFVAVMSADTANICGQLALATAEDCATPTSNICVYSAEVL